MEWDLIVVGGGAAGVFAALAAAEANPNLRILVLEKGSLPLAKVKISGGGRCNVTHACYDPDRLVEFYPRGGRELLGPFHRFQPADAMRWFEERGVALKTEADGRIFPISDSSQTIIDCLLGHARRLGVQLRAHAPVERIQPPDEGTPFQVELRGGETLAARKVLLASGGGRGGMALAASLGHTIQPPVPSLFTFTIQDPRLTGLAGVSVERTRLRLVEVGLEEEGPLLITHWGLSGPAALRLSAWGARALHSAHYRTDLRINWIPFAAPEEVSRALSQTRAVAPRQRPFAHVPAGIEAPGARLPLRLWQRLVAAAGFGETDTWAQASNQVVARLAGELTGGLYRIQGKGEFKEEFVTCGGVALDEVDFRTMESRVCHGLYLAGEVLDIDGLTGGFNFQSAWTTGWLAGKAIG
ncbi:MAG TPA: NAD(P)/FAD-dependent oxidoreductase [Anaerolineaceae bacterium]|nr:NAD(P)/FAD-dependent oxidoreductase [Anaerolineaceae bacterium]